MAATPAPRAHEHSVLVDPHAVRDVDEAEQLVGHVGLVDQRRMLGVRCLDPRTSSLDATRVECHGDDLQPLREQLAAQCLPPGQVEAAASIAGPRGDQVLLSFTVETEQAAKLAGKDISLVKTVSLPTLQTTGGSK